MLKNACELKEEIPSNLSAITISTNSKSNVSWYFFLTISLLLRY